MTDLLLDGFCDLQFAVMKKGDELADCTVESLSSKSLIGCILKGRVVNIQDGLQAAFVDCGLSRNCYLSVNEYSTNLKSYDSAIREENVKRILDLRVGEEILVQVTKDAIGSKGVKVTTQFSYVGTALIYLPDSEFVGVSRKITDEDVRENLLNKVTKLKKKGEGFVVRTRAEFLSHKTFTEQAAQLRALHTEMLKKAKTAKVGDMVFDCSDLTYKVLREFLGDDDAGKVICGDEKMYEEAKRILSSTPGYNMKNLISYKGTRDLITEYGMLGQFEQLLVEDVVLPSGARLVIQRTEAVTAIDVNSARYVCCEGTTFEQMAFEVNMASCAEIAKQVRLRNVGGIVIVDFIDMTDPEHKSAVTEELEKWLLKDRAKCKVIPMSDLCVVEFTRMRLSSDVATITVRPCEKCGGRGYHRSAKMLAFSLRAKITEKMLAGYKNVIVDLNEEFMLEILEKEILSKEVHGIWSKMQIYLIPHKTYLYERYTLSANNYSVLQVPETAQILY